MIMDGQVFSTLFIATVSSELPVLFSVRSISDETFTYSIDIGATASVTERWRPDLAWLGSHLDEGGRGHHRL